MLYEELSENKGKVYFSPLERGYARTYGNSLRRVLLSSMPGTSIIGMKIDGTNHEFHMIDGTVNDGTEIINNLKEMKFSYDGEDVIELRFTAKKSGAYTAKDIKLPKGVSCLTPKMPFVKLTGEREVNIVLYLRQGRGYVDASLHQEFEGEGFEDIIQIDGDFSPIETVEVQVDNMRVGQDTSFEKLTLVIETNGMIKPDKAVTLAAHIIREQLAFVDDMKEYIEEYELIEEEKQKENEILGMMIEELSLSVRPYNCLKNAGYHSVGQVLQLTRNQLGAIDQLGLKSINEIIDKIAELGYKLRED